MGRTLESRRRPLGLLSIILLSMIGHYYEGFRQKSDKVSCIFKKKKRHTSQCMGNDEVERMKANRKMS